MNVATKIMRIAMLVMVALMVIVHTVDWYMKGDLSKLGWFTILIGIGLVLAMISRKYWPDEEIFIATGTFTVRAIAFRDLIGLFAMGIGAGSFATSAVFLFGRDDALAWLFVTVALSSAVTAFLIGRRTLRKIPSSPEDPRLDGTAAAFSNGE